MVEIRNNIGYNDLSQIIQDYEYEKQLNMEGMNTYGNKIAFDCIVKNSTCAKYFNATDCLYKTKYYRPITENFGSYINNLDELNTRNKIKEGRIEEENYLYNCNELKNEIEVNICKN